MYLCQNVFQKKNQLIIKFKVGSDANIQFIMILKFVGINFK